MHCYSAVKVQLLLHDLHGATVASSPVFPCAHTHLPQTFRLDAVWWVRGPFLFRALKYIDFGTLDACRLHHQLSAHRQSRGAGRRQHVGFVLFNRVSSYSIPRRFYHAVQTFKLLGLQIHSNIFSFFQSVVTKFVKFQALSCHFISILAIHQLNGRNG